MQVDEQQKTHPMPTPRAWALKREGQQHQQKKYQVQVHKHLQQDQEPLGMERSRNLHKGQ